MSTDALFNDIQAFINESKRLLSQGSILQLEGHLDSRVQQLCDQVLALSETERKQYASKLELLMKELQQLGDALTEERDGVSSTMKNISSHRKANVAYRTADATDGFGKKDN